ncbi:MAG: 4Fe-4S binding protein [Methanobrevibacter sp.]|uniref:4Fe-4S binding protein n=1 Tax=uncultured Methanobrevibacter sp. TaxID=253161 RepID=UPI0025E18A25|nr:4Fe-4S binding protein [uncultured Methanobrevibacter sp.]MEE1128514.1 4Fe-4S binding protein [Methanobrevibacter sp.]
MFNSGNCTTCTTCGSCQQTPTVDTPHLFCMNCQPSEAPCLLACNENAVEVLGGAITINWDKCTRCKKCVEVCPIDVIKI